jgi:hypothetical protein
MSYEIAEKILSASRGARFIKADLHIHTPASLDWDHRNPEAEFHSTKITPRHIVQAALAENLELIAITDHNSVEWCEGVIREAAGTPLSVLPGFELTVRPGIHVLVIFDKDQRVEELRDLLIKLGIKRNKFGDPSEMTEETIEDKSGAFRLVRMLQDAGGLVIPAHVDANSGVVGRLGGGKAVEDFLVQGKCGLLEVIKQIPPVVSSMLKENCRCFGILRNSDAHRLDYIGKNSMWLKMDAPSLNGLRQIAFEPLTRIITESKPLSDAKPRVLGMFSNGSLLRDGLFAFNEDLNCIIGGRGAGKSAVIDYLRFGLGNEPVDLELKEKFIKRLVGLICHSNTVYVLVSDAKGGLWLYERTFEFEELKKGSAKTYNLISKPAKVARVLTDKGKLVYLNEDSPEFKIKFYGQGEVQSITDTAAPDRQLELVDDFIRTNLAPRLEKVKSLEGVIRSKELDILGIDGDLKRLREQIDTLPEIEGRIEEIERDLKESRLESHQVWEDANGWVVKSLGHLEQQKNKLTSVSINEVDIKNFTLPDEKAQSALTALLSRIAEVLKIMQSAQEELKDQVQSIVSSVSEAKKLWDAEYEQERAHHIEVLRNQGVENLGALNRELAEKRHLRDEIKDKQIAHLGSLEKERTITWEEWRKRLKELSTEWEGIRECRKFAAEEMTSRLAGVVSVRIDDRRNLNNFHEALMRNRPRNVPNYDEQMQKIVESCMPEAFVNFIRNDDADGLCKATAITPGTASKLMQIGEEELMLIERVRCDDIAEIKLVREGKEKDLGHLSEGEKCTAILSIVLLDEACPLVIDQPEDELDHAFIMSNVVETLGRVKQKSDPLAKNFEPKKGRQFIIATHHQNIPVLGDAELVIKMRKIPGDPRCDSESSNGLEHPDTMRHILSLEGGREAFDRRHRKYASTT